MGQGLFMHCNVVDTAYISFYLYCLGPSFLEDVRPHSFTRALDGSVEAEAFSAQVLPLHQLCRLLHLHHHVRVRRREIPLHEKGKCTVLTTTSR